MEAVKTLYLTKLKSLTDQFNEGVDEDEETDDKWISATYGIGPRSALEYPPQVLTSIVI